MGELAARSSAMCSAEVCTLMAILMTSCKLIYSMNSMRSVNVGLVAILRQGHTAVLFMLLLRGEA